MTQRHDELPFLDIAMQDCGAVLGRRGAGKSATARFLLERELKAGHRCGCIDPKGDYWGIRANKDGTPSQFPVIVFGGEHADVLIDDKMGAALGTALASSSNSFIIDLSGFSQAGMRRFMSAFAAAFFHVNRQPITLFVDEADQLAPQRVPAEAAQLLHHMESLIRQGRQRGIVMWMLTQRPAVLNKNILSQAETLLAMKMTGPHDRAAIRGWMDAHDPVKSSEVEKGLSKLKVGQAYAWVPGADYLDMVQFPLFETYDSGRAPKHGEIVGAVALAPLDVGEIQRLLSAEDEKDSELENMRVENANLRDQLRGERQRHRETKDALERVSFREDRILEILTGLQTRIGAAIGSPPIEAVGLDQPFEAFTWAEAKDGVMRAIPRAGDNPDVAKAAGRRVRAANRKAD